MFWSLAPLVFACILLAGLVGMCSFRPDGPQEGRCRSTTHPTRFRLTQTLSASPVRLPWAARGLAAQFGPPRRYRGGTHGSEDRREGACGDNHRRLCGTVADVSQPDAEQRRRGQSSSTRSIRRYPTGTQDVSGVKWIVGEGGDGIEPVWTTRLDSPAGPAQVAVTGAGSGRRTSGRWRSQPSNTATLVPER